MTRARNIAGFSTITTTPSPVNVGPIGVLTATRIDGEFGDRLDISARNLTVAGIAATNLQVSGITTGLNVSGIITAQNGINFNGTSTGLNVSGVTTVADLSATTVSIAGTLTYEDVTNVDSVGVVTARGLNIFGNTTGLNATGVSTFTGDVSIADKIIHTGDTNTAIRFPAADTVTVETGGNEGIRIDSGGRLLVGTNAARTFGGGVYAHLQLEGTTQQGSQFTVTRNTNDTYSPNISLVKTRGTSDGAVTTVQDNDSLGTIQFRGADGSDVFAVAASITGEVDGSPSDGTDMPGALVFGTTADGAASPTERLRITSDGKVGINRTSPAEMLEVGGSVAMIGGSLKLDSHPLVSTANFTDISGGSYTARLGSTGTSTIRSTQIYGGGGHIATFDGVNTRLGIATVAPNMSLHVLSSTDDVARFQSTNSGTGAAITLDHIGSSPADNDIVAKIVFNGQDDAFNTTTYADIKCISSDVSNGSETAHLDFSTRGYNSFNSIFRLNNRGTASAPSYTADDHNGIIFDVYNTGNPYPRYMNIIAKSAGDTDSNIAFWTEAVGGSPTEKVRITAAGDIGIGLASPLARLHTTTAYNKTGAIITGGGVGYNNSLEVNNANGTRVFTVDGGGAAVTTNLSGRNMIINGDMRVAQRGTSASYSSSGSAIHCVDRIVFQSNGSSGTVAQVTQRPNNEFQYSVKATVTTPVSGSLAAGNFFGFVYKIERQDVQRLDYGSTTAKTSTISFWVKGSLAGKIGVQCNRNSRIFSTNVDIVANTWKFVEVVVPADTSTALSGTMYENGFQIQINAGAGSNATSGTTGGNWIGFHVAYTAGFTAGQQGAYLTTDNSTFQITGLQFEIGSKATPFEHKSYSEEHLRCARYYQEQQGHSDLYIQAGKGQGSTTADVGHSLVVPMRAQPSATMGANRVFHDGGLSGSSNAPTVTDWDNAHSPHSSVISLNLSGHSGFTNNEVLTWCPHSSLLQLDAEL